MKIVLASSSIGRKSILEQLGLKFLVLPANIDEERFIPSGDIPLSASKLMLQQIAKAKALAVIDKLSASTTKAKPILIIAADSMVFYKNKVYGKPKSKEQARKVLQMLSGKSHHFITGLYIINTKSKKTYQFSQETKVVFKNFDCEEIDRYIKIASVTSYAAGYSLEQKGAEIIRPKITLVGSRSNVLGLPIDKLLPTLKKEGVSIPVSPKSQK